MTRGDPAVLDGIARAFRQSGYDGASLSTLSDASRLGRASLYHRFPAGKLDMALAAVRHANAAFRGEVLDAVAAGVDAKARLRRFARALDRYYGGGADPCLLGVLTLGDIAPALRTVVREGFVSWIDALAAILVDAGLPATGARVRAEDAVARVQGALLLTRALGHPRPLRRVLAALPSLSDT